MVANTGGMKREVAKREFATLLAGADSDRMRGSAGGAEARRRQRSEWRAIRHRGSAR
jgi:hypothetical protein